MRLRNKKMIALVAAGIMISTTLTVGASQIKRQIEVHYNNVRVAVNGTYKPTNREPFLYDSTVYVGLRDVGELLGAGVDWDSSTRTVKLDTSKLQGNAAQVAQLQQQVVTLNSQLVEANKIIAQYEAQLKEKEEPTMDTRVLERFLKETFDGDYNISWDFRVKVSDDTLEVTTRIDTKKDQRAYERLSQDKIESFLKEVAQELQKEVRNTYNVRNAIVEGKLYDTEQRETLAEFDIDSRGRYFYKWVKAVAIDTQKLKDYEWIVESNYRSFPAVNMTGFDATSIRIRRINLETSNNKIVFKVHTSLDSFSRPYWNRLNLSDATALASFMKAIQQDLQNEFKDAVVEGYVYDSYEKQMASYTTKLTLH